MFIVLLGLFTIVAEPILCGLVLCTLWSWFVASTFHLPNLTIPVALGIALLVSMLTGPHHNPKQDKLVEEKKWGEFFLGVLLRPLLVLLIGAIYHAFM